MGPEASTKNMPEKTNMAGDWVQVHKRGLLGFVFIDLYTVVTSGFFGLLCLGGLALWAANLLTFAGLQLPNELDWHLKSGFQRESWGQNVLGVVLLLTAGALAGAFAWWNLKGVWACLLDLVCPAVTYHGNVQSVRVVTRAGHNTDVRYWAVNAGQKTFSIAYLDTDPRRFKTEVTTSKEIRARYLRGTGEVTQMWVKQT